MALLRYGVAWSDLACVSTGQVAAVQDGPLGVGTWSRVPLGRRVMTSVGGRVRGEGEQQPPIYSERRPCRFAGRWLLADQSGRWAWSQGFGLSRRARLGRPGAWAAPLPCGLVLTRPAPPAHPPGARNTIMGATEVEPGASESGHGQGKDRAWAWPLARPRSCPDPATSLSPHPHVPLTCAIYCAVPSSPRGLFPADLNCSQAETLPLCWGALGRRASRCPRCPLWLGLPARRVPGNHAGVSLHPCSQNPALP